MPATEPSTSRRPALDPRFVTRTFFVLGVVLLIGLSIKLAQLWVLLFGAVVAAVILRSIADPLERLARVPRGWSVFAAALIVIAVIGLSSWLFGYQIGQQAQQLIAVLPSAWEQLQGRLATNPIGAQVLDQARNLGDQADRVFALAPKFAAGLASGVTTLLLVVVAGIYLATEPASSRDGVLSMFPETARPRLREVMDTCGRALKGWFGAQLVSMMLVGSLVGLGLWALKAPAPLALGLFAGLAQFVPILGPILSAVPALLIAATVSVQQLVLTLVLFVAVSQLESNFITPMVQKNVANLPVVFGIFAVVGFTTLFGPVGGLFATPMALVIYTAVTLLYRQDVLGDADAHAPGEPKRPKAGT